MLNRINGLYMPLINKAFSIIAPLIYATALINKAFMPMVAHWWLKWWRIGALIDCAMLQLDRTLDRALIYAENLRLYMHTPVCCFVISIAFDMKR